MRRALPENRWGKVETLFLEAAELPPGLREAFIAARCGEDVHLREEVMSLLRYDTGATAERCWTRCRPAPRALSATNLAAGRMVGPYRIEHEIGRSGMAVVYPAVRADGEFRQTRCHQAD